MTRSNLARTSRRLPTFIAGLAVVAASLAIACSPPPKPPTVAPPADPLPAVPVADSPAELPSAVLPDGANIIIEVATTPEELSQGLMFRPSLAEDRGMLLFFDSETFPHIWMKNVFIPLDVVYLDNSGIVVEVVENAPPCKAEPCPHYIPKNPARAVLELAANTAAQHGVIEGSTISFSRVPGYPVDG